MAKRKPVTVTMKLNKNGTMTLRSTGGFDLRKIMPQKTQAEEASAPSEPKMTGWQDISTAPRNTKVLAAYRNENGKWRIVTACYHTELPWSDEYGDHEEEFAPEAWYEESDSSEVIYQTSSLPTHWQPLPPPPATTEGQTNG